MSRYIAAAVTKYSCACSRFSPVSAKLAKAEVAVGDDGTHTDLRGERKCVTVVTLSVLRRIEAGGDVAKQAESPGLVVASTGLAGNRHGSPGQSKSLLKPVGENVRFTQVEAEERLDKSESHSLDGVQRA